MSVLLRTIKVLSLMFVSTESFAAAQMNLTPGVTEISQDVYDLHTLVLWICVVIGAGVFGVIFYSMFAHRKSKGAVAANFHDSMTVEVLWTVIPFLILVGMAVPAAKTLIKMESPADDAEVTIKITGYQWKWNYDYMHEGFNFFSNLATSSRDVIYADNNITVIGPRIPIIGPINSYTPLTGLHGIPISLISISKTKSFKGWLQLREINCTINWQGV